MTEIVPHPDLHYQHIDCIDSTNAFLLRPDQDANQLLSAETQTYGYGRQKSRWVDEGNSLLFSLSTSFVADRDLSAWPIQVALVLSKLFNHLDYNNNNTIYQIKWPNDIYRQNDHGDWGKCTGILVESTIGSIGKMVTGVGINLSPLKETITHDYPTSYFSTTMDKTTLTIILGNALYLAWKQFVQQPKVNPKQFAQFDYLKDKPLVATNLHNQSQQRGLGAGINTQGHLQLQQEQQRITLAGQYRIRMV